MITLNSRIKSPEFVRDRNTIETYRKEIKGYRTLTLEEERLLGLEIQNGNKKALQALVQGNLKFVIAVCYNYAGRGLPFGDLVNEGNLGLIRAAQRFDGSMNFKFISYAVWWIRQGILTALAEQTRSLNVSTSQIDSIRVIKAASRKLEQEFHRVPNTDELAFHTGKSAESILAIKILTMPSISLDHAFNGEGGESLGEGLEDRNTEATDEAALRHLLKKKVQGILGGLGERERTILSLYYGIGSETKHNLTEIGVRFNLTRERIRQIRDRALQKLQVPAKRGLPAFEKTIHP